MVNTFGQKKRGINMYIIQMRGLHGSECWYDFDTAEDETKAEMRLSWIRNYYKDDDFRLIKEGTDG